MPLERHEIYKFVVIEEKLAIPPLFTSFSGESVNTSMLHVLLIAVYIGCASAKSQTAQIKGSLVHVNTCIQAHTQKRKNPLKANHYFSGWFGFNDKKQFLLHCSECLSSCPFISETTEL